MSHILEYNSFSKQFKYKPAVNKLGDTFISLIIIIIMVVTNWLFGEIFGNLSQQQLPQKFRVETHATVLQRVHVCKYPNLEARCLCIIEKSMILRVKLVVATENDFNCANVAFKPNQFYSIVKFNQINRRRNKIQTIKTMEKSVAKQE